MEHKNFEAMIEILVTAIAIHEKEEAFFRRSANASSSEVAKALFLEIAEDLFEHRRTLEARRRKLVDALEDLESAQKTGKKEAKLEGGAVTRDPVCGMRVNAATSGYSSTFREKRYYFCSAGCRDAFNVAPEKYVNQ